MLTLERKDTQMHGSFLKVRLPVIPRHNLYNFTPIGKNSSASQLIPMQYVHLLWCLNDEVKCI